MDTNLVPSGNHKQIKVKSQNSAEGHNKLLHEESNARIPSAKVGTFIPIPSFPLDDLLSSSKSITILGKLKKSISFFK